MNISITSEPREASTYNEEPQPEITRIIPSKDEERDLAHENNVRIGYSEELYNNSVVHIPTNHTIH